MRPPDNSLHEICGLQERASELAIQVGEKLKAGMPPQRLVSLLKEQAEAVARLHTRLVQAVTEISSCHHAKDGVELERIKASFQTLVEAAEENYRLATQKGILLPGIGGKPHTPRPSPPRKAPNASLT